jgi:adenine-specific DNA-methyltransferase
MPILDWVNKAQATISADAVPYHLLQLKFSHGDDANENLLIQDDNLLALKALLPLYRGQVKCIFIDPPYNTQSAFEHYDDKLEHSQWLSMMYSRLALLRDLLAEDGSIWITIDDSEGHYLKVLCDEIFGRKNFVANVVWQKKSSPQPNAVWLSDSHDHILVYAKDKEKWRPNKLPRTDEQNAIYKHSDEYDGIDEEGNPYGRGPWYPGDATASLRGGARGAQFARTGVSANIFTVNAPGGKKINPPAGTCWRFSPDRFQQMVDDHRITFGATGNNRPCVKRFLSELEGRGVVPMTVWHYKDVGENRNAAAEVKAFNPDDPFATPKPEKLIERILHIGSGAGDLVLDSFLGSGTTAAVAHKMGRRWIGIEEGEHAETHCLPRLTAVVDGEQGGISKDVGWRGGGGFRYYTLGERVFDADGAIHDGVRFSALAGYLWHFETGEPASKRFAKPLLGVHNGTGYYLLYNGILGDHRPQGGNVLTSKVLAHLEADFPHDGPRVIYGEKTLLGEMRLREAGIEFKQIPHDIKAR